MNELNGIFDEKLVGRLNLEARIWSGNLCSPLTERVNRQEAAHTACPSAFDYRQQILIEFETLRDQKPDVDPKTLWDLAETVVLQRRLGALALSPSERDALCPIVGKPTSAPKEAEPPSKKRRAEANTGAQQGAASSPASGLAQTICDNPGG